jgi:hypothetical protein
MTDQIEKIIAELKAVQTKLPELRDLFWLKIDRYNEADRQRGEIFDEKFKRQSVNLCRVIDSFVAFVGKSFAPSAEDIAKTNAMERLRKEFSDFDEWNETAKKAIIEREAKVISSTIKPKTERKTRITKHFPKQSPLSMRVIFPDGTIIEEHKASLTFIKTIEKIGIEKVEQLKMEHVVRADGQFDRYKAQVVKVGSMYVNTHSSTTEKKRILDAVSKRLNLNLQVEVTKTTNQ